MRCSIAKAKYLKDNVELILSSMNLELNKLYPVSKVQPYLDTIDNINNTLVEGELLVGIKGDITNPDGLVKIALNLDIRNEPDETTESNGALEGLQSNRLIEELDKERVPITNFLNTAFEVVIKMNEKSFEDAIKELPYGTKSDFRSIKTAFTTMDRDNVEEGLGALGTFIAEGVVTTRQIVNAYNKLDEATEEDFVVLQELRDLSNTFLPFFDELSRVSSASNYLGKLAREVKDNIDTVEKKYRTKALEFSIEQLAGITDPIADKLTREKNEKIARIKSLNISQSLKQERINRIEKQYEGKIPTRDLLQSTLLGEEGDISFLTSMIRAGSANPDIVISSFVETARSAMNNVRIAMIAEREEFGRALELFEQGTRRSDSLVGDMANATKAFEKDPEKLFDRVVELVEEFYYDKVNQKIESRQSVMLVSNYDRAFTTELSKLKAEQAMAFDYRANNLELTPELESVEGRLKEFIKNRTVLPYSQLFYDIDSMLDQEVGGKTLREWRRESYEPITSLRAEIRMQDYVPTEEQAEAYFLLNQEQMKVSSTEGKEPGSIEYQVAVGLKAYSNAMKPYRSFVVTDEQRNAFEQAYNRIKRKESNGQLEPGSTQRWLMLNAKTETTEAYKTRKQDIIIELESIAEQVHAVMGVPYQKGIGSEMAAALNKANPYRIDGVIDATRMDQETLEEVNNHHRKHVESYMTDPSLMHLSEAQLVQLKGLRERAIRMTMDPQVTKNVQDQAWNDYKAFKQQHAKVVPSAAKQLMNRRDELLKELNEMEFTQETEAYRAEYRKQLSLFLAGQDITSIPKEFSDGAYTYTYLNESEWLIDIGGEKHKITSEGIENVWRSTFDKEFKNSDWYKENHLVQLKWNKDKKAYEEVYKPTLPWVHKVPRDSSNILTNQPNRMWREQVYSPELMNNDYAKDIKGNPLPNAAEPFNPKFRDLDPHEKEYLKFIKDKYYQAQERVPNNMSMGDRIPAIEVGASFYDWIASKNPGKAVKQFGRMFYETEQDVDEAYGDTDGRMKKIQPMYFRGNLDVDLQSFNLHKIMLQYTAESYKYAQIQKHVYPLGKALEDVLSIHSPKSDLKNKSLLKYGINQYLNGSNNRRLEVFREFHNTIVYGERMVASAKSLEITEDTPVLGRIRGLRGKVFRLDKILGSLLGMRAFSLMSGNSLGQIPNFLNGQINMWIEAASKKGGRFTKAQWYQANKEVIQKHIGQYIRDSFKTRDKSKFTLMLDYFDGIPGEFLNTVGYELDSNAARSLASTDAFFMTKNAVELELAMSTTLAVLKNTFINGENIMDLFEVKGGVLQLKEGKEFSIQDRDRVIRTIQGAHMDINGNYATFDKTIAEKYWLGRAVFFLKKFVVPFFERRFSKNRYSVIHDGLTEGYWRSGSRAVLDVLQDSYENFKLHKSPKFMSVYNTLSPDEALAMKRFLLEWAIWGSLYIAGSMLWDDDDEDRFKDLEKKNIAYQTMVYSILKTRVEIETFIVPFSLNEWNNMARQSTNEVLPMAKEIFNILAKDFDIDEEYFLTRYKRDQGRIEKGDIRLYHDLAKLLGSIQRKQDPIQAIKTLESIQKR